MEELFLKDIKANGENIISWQFVEPVEDCRVYFKKDEDGCGFYFCSVIIRGGYIVDEEDELWIPDRTTVEILYCGGASFDGVRHFFLGSEQTKNYGYDYYPSLKKHIAILNAIKELEKLYCPAYEDNKK